MNSSLAQWAIRNQVTPQALAELQGLFNLDGVGEMPPAHLGVSEGAVQSVVRLEAAQKGVRLWRNNVGALPDARGVPVRYGLANDSPQLNRIIKSGDLIGWRKVIIQPWQVGHSIAQFVSRECKKVGWSYTGVDRETAQLKWAEMILADGGDSGFCTGEGTL